MLLFFKKEVPFFFEKKNQKTLIHLGLCGPNFLRAEFAGLHEKLDRLEIHDEKAHSIDMERNDAPSLWVEALARSDAELARGERVPASQVHEDIRKAIADMDDDLAAVTDQPGSLSDRT